MGALSVISWGFLAGLWSVAILSWFAVWAVRRRRRISLALTAAAAVVLSLASAADAVNAHYQYLPRVSDVVGEYNWPVVGQGALQRLGDASSLPPTPVASASGSAAASLTVPELAAPSAPPASSTPAAAAATSTHPRGAVVTLHVPDSRVGFPAREVLVYLPPQYFSDVSERFPVVYLLHGSPGIPVDWLRGADAAQAGLDAARLDRPQILVMPRLSRNWLDDSECVNGSHMHVEDFVTKDLVPSIDAQLRTLADRTDRSVGGMSAGGYCALNLGLRDRALFGSIIDMSGYTHPTHAGGMTALFGRRPDIASVVAANSPDVYARLLPEGTDTRIFMLCGTGDRTALAQMQSVGNVLRARGVSVSWKTLPGGHTFGVWRPGLLDALNSWTPE